MPFEFQITRRVEFSDTDLAGIMHFSNFFRFMEAAEHAFMRSLGYSVTMSGLGRNLGLPRVHAACDYLAPVYFEDEIRVHLIVRKKSARSVAYQFVFHRQDGNEPRLVARGDLVVVCVQRQSNGALKAVPLPKKLAAKIHPAPAPNVDARPPVTNHADRRAIGRPMRLTRGRRRNLAPVIAN
jgi:acyl-CoA thioester hydrolase